MPHHHADPADWAPVDPDVDLRHPPAPRGPVERSVLLAIALGGAVGATARYAVGLAWPTGPDSFPAATMAVNVTGCALIGVLMVLVVDVWTRQRLLRPFLGTGVLGGFTTFSTYAVDIERLVSADRLGIAASYLTMTFAGCMLSVWAATIATRRLVRSRATP